MLDKSRSYGVVYGLPGVAFEQDGKEYDPQGNPIESNETEPKKRGRPFKKAEDQE